MADKASAIGVGMKVHFRSHVYKAPYAPFYDAYKGHAFTVVEIERGHVQLKGPVKVAGWVHLEDLKQV